VRGIEKTRHAASVRGGLRSRLVGHQPAVILGDMTPSLPEGKALRCELVRDIAGSTEADVVRETRITRRTIRKAMGRR